MVPKTRGGGTPSGGEMGEAMHSVTHCQGGIGWGADSKTHLHSDGLCNPAEPATAVLSDPYGRVPLGPPYRETGVAIHRWSHCFFPPMVSQPYRLLHPPLLSA